MSSPGWVPGTETEGRYSSWPAQAGAWAWEGPAERWHRTWRACCPQSSAGCCCGPTPRSACWAWGGETGQDAAARCSWRNWTPRGFRTSAHPQEVWQSSAELSTLWAELSCWIHCTECSDRGQMRWCWPRTPGMKSWKKIGYYGPEALYTEQDCLEECLLLQNKAGLS